MPGDGSRAVIRGVRGMADVYLKLMQNLNLILFPGET